MRRRNVGKKGSRAVRTRKELGFLVGEKKQFRAIVGRTSMTSWKTSGIRQETLELKALYEWDNPDRLLADHLWVKLDDFCNRDILDELLSVETNIVKRIVFTGRVYVYAEPFKGRGFHSFHGFHYSIGEMEVCETRPKVESVESVA